jgi:hypothetical protein
MRFRFTIRDLLSAISLRHHQSKGESRELGGN